MAKKTKQYHIEALIHILPDKDGRGRKESVVSGWRPTFRYDHHDWVCNVDVKNDCTLNPDDKGFVFITLASPDKHKDNIEIGMKFLLREGYKTAATGEVLRLIGDFGK